MQIKTQIVLLLTAWSAGAAFADDRVYPKQGATASGKIVNITPAEITINARGKDQKFAISDVLKVTFDDEPNGLERGREQVLLGQYEQALEELKKLDPSSAGNPLIAQDIEFYRWYSEGKLSLAGSGDKNAAIKGLFALANKNSKTHHLYDLSEMLGELSLAIGQPARATSFFNMLLSAPGAETKAKGMLRLGEAELAQNKVSEAKKRFGQLAAAPNSSPEMIRIKNLADVHMAVCENLEGNSQQALASLNGMVQKFDSTDQELFARINNAKGACYKSLEQPKQALLSYLQTDLLFFTEPEAHAEALYHLKNLWPTVGNPTRAADAQARLVNRYASSVWAGKP